MRALSRWMDLSLRVKGFVVGTALAAALMLAAETTYFSADRETLAQHTAAHALKVVQHMQNLQACETDSVAQIRAYWITQDENFANAVRRDFGTFDDTLQTLVELAVQNPGERHRLSEISGLERLRVERLFSALTRIGLGTLSDEGFRRELRAGEQERHRLENLLNAMQLDEEQSLNAALAELNQAHAATKAGMWQVFCLAAGSSLLVWMMFTYGIRHRIRLLKESLAAIGSAQFVDLRAADQLKAVCEGLVHTAQTLAQKNKVFEKAFHGVAQVSAAGHVTMNRACAQMLSLPEHGPGANLFDMVPVEDRPSLDQGLAQMRAEGRADASVRILKPDGSMLDLADGGFYVFLRDNSHHKIAEAALLRAKDAAVASNVAKTRFLAKVGHEIRTPLNAILGSADLLAETTLTADQAEYVTIFQRNSRRLVGLINDFLDFSKIEAGAVRVDKVPFRVRQTLYEVVDTFRDTASRKGLALDCHADPGVPEWQLGDPHRLQQVLTNLVSNAMKFTDAGRVELHASITLAADQAHLRFEVSDTGPGIRAADCEKIFSPFTQLKNPSMPIQGTGLGLTISRELVELMNGSIGVDSKEGVGSTFYFELPLEQAEPPVSSRAAGILPGPGASGRELTLSLDRATRILIAEDTADNRLLIQAYLKDQPVRLRFAENGQEVMAALSAGEVFDLILMDLDMPLVDGCAATRWVRAWQTQRKIPPTPIVALSAHAMHDMVRASLDAGCVAHVAKPVDRGTLIETIALYAQPAAQRESYEARQAAVSEEVAALVPNYLASQSRQIQEAQEQLRHHDFDSIRRFGHNLKGTGRGYGFPEIEKLGRDLEQAAKENREQSITENLEALYRFVSDASAQCPGARVA